MEAKADYLVLELLQSQIQHFLLKTELSYRLEMQIMQEIRSLIKT